MFFLRRFPLRRLRPWLLRLRGLQARIVIAFVALLCTLQVAAFFIVQVAGTTTSEDNLANELVTGERVFNRILEQNREQLAQGARILSSDFAFRQAVGTNDRATIASALGNHGARINADLMVLVGLDHRVIAETLQMSSPAERLAAMDPLIDVAESKGSASLMIRIDDAIYQVVVVPMLAPVRIAWVAMGFRIDDADARDLKKLTGLQVSFLSRAEDGDWHIEGTTLPDKLSPALVAALSDGKLTASQGTAKMTLDGDAYMTLVSNEGTSTDSSTVAVLQRPLDDALKPFRQLQRQLLLVSGFALLLTVASSLLIARGIARPVQKLAAFARRIAAGHYDTPLENQRNDEIGDLTLAFEHMRKRVTEREGRILDLAYRDTLTGLPNRALFADRLKEAIESARRISRPLTVIMMDLDRFKTVNDALGHEGGDQLLIEVGKRLQGVIRRKSDTIARMGGDEFAVLLPLDDACDVMRIVHKLLQCLETPVAIGGHLVDARASLGIATYPDHGDDLLALLRHADSAMYLAKRNHSGYATYDPRCDEGSRERLSLMSDLRRAVERDELVVYYQPKIDLASGGELHAECLVRWIHETRGFVPPDQFIPFAEQTGYISVITEWVIGKALAQLRAWRDDGLAMNLSINISTSDLMNVAFPAQLAALLAAHHCRAAWLVLEITETSILDDPAHAQANIDRLHAQGCRISIDDFGTGYSSLAYLKRLRVDELKIDKSFVIGMATDPSDAVIVRSTIDLGHHMGLKVVAEGVETDAALRVLRELGCDMAQGYLMSRPLPAADFTNWLAESSWTARKISMEALAA